MNSRIFNLIVLLAAVDFGMTACGKNNPPTSPTPAIPPPSYTLAGFFGKAGTAPMDSPMGIGISGNTLWVGNNYGAGLQAWTLGGSLSLSVTAYNSNALQPWGVTVGPDGYIYAGDCDLYQIVEFGPTGNYVGVFGNAQIGSSQPSGIVVDSTDVYICLHQISGQIYHYTVSGTGASKTFNYQNSFGDTGVGALIEPRGICLNGEFLWVADTGNYRLVEFNLAGVFQAAVPLQSFGAPSAVVVDSFGNLIASDTLDSEIQVFNPAGYPVTTFGRGDFVGPMALSLDPSNNLYVADDGANQVVMFKRN